MKVALIITTILMISGHYQAYRTGYGVDSKQPSRN